MSNNAHILDLLQAAATKDPYNNLLAIATKWKNEGVTQVDVYLRFTDLLTCTPTTAAYYDHVLDAMDEIQCGVYNGGIYPTVLSNEEISSAKG